MLPVYCGRDLFAQLLAAFVTAVRSGDRDEVLRFYAVVERMRRGCQDEEMRGSLGMLLATSQIARPVFENVRVTSLDPAIWQ